MFTLPTLQDLKNLTVPAIDLTRIDVRNFDMPKFDMPKFDMPKFDMPKFEMPAVDVDRVVGFARDAAYVGVGAVAVAAHEVNTRRSELTERITGVVTEQVAPRIRQAVARVA